MKKLRRGCKAPKNLSEGYFALSKQFPALHSLFCQLAQNKYPDFLDVMAAIEELVAFNAKDDSLVVDNCIDNLKMSLNKCRFCS